MDTVCNKKTNVIDAKSSSTLYTQQPVDDDVWQDLLSITPDLPDHREKCEKCR